VQQHANQSKSCQCKNSDYVTEMTISTPINIPEMSAYLAHTH